jgi:hypothetical protein
MARSAIIDFRTDIVTKLIIPFEIHNSMYHLERIVYQ